MIGQVADVEISGDRGADAGDRISFAVVVVVVIVFLFFFFLLLLFLLIRLLQVFLLARARSDAVRKTGGFLLFFLVRREI